MATQAERDEFARLSAGTTTPIVAVIELPKLADALGERLPWAAPQLRDFDDKLEVWRKSILFGAGGGGTIVQVGTAAPAVPPGVGPPAQYHTLLDANLHTDTVLQAPTRGSLVYGNADATTKWDELVIGATAKYLRSNGTDPSWQTISASDITGLAHNVLSATHTDTLAASVVRGDLIIGNVTPLWSRLGISGSTGKFLKSDGADPSWQSIVVTDIGSGAALTTISDTNVGLDVSVGGATALLTAAALSVTWNGVLSLLRGGTNNTMTASAGAVVFSNSTQLALTAVGTTGQILVSQGTGTPIWQTAAASGAPVDAEYIVAALNGTLTAERVLTGTANQVNVVFTAGLATLSTPQNIHTAATPTFAGLTISAFTEGSVIFAGAGGVLSEDNATLFWNNTSKHFGIGTGNPIYPLHVTQSSASLYLALFTQQHADNAGVWIDISLSAATPILQLTQDNGDVLRAQFNGDGTAYFNTHFRWGADITYDLGVDGINRPRDLFLGRSAYIQSGLYTLATSPAQIISDQNDYAIGIGTFFRLSSDASRTITGLTGGTDGKHLILVNSGSFNIVLANQSASSAAANRIITGTGANITLLPDERVEATYDATTERWRCGAKVYAGGSGGVTSVDMTVPAFLSVSGSPITTAGTLAVSLSGTALPIANGGTAGTTALAAFNNLSPLTTRGDLLTRDATNNIRRALGTVGKVLRSDGTDPLWSTFTIPDTYAQGDLIYASATNVLTALAKNASATRYLSNTGTTNNPAWAQVDMSNGVTGDLPFANLAQGAALSVFGVTGNAIADMASIVAGSDFQVVRRSGTSVAFGSINLASTNAVTGTLVVGNGGTGAATFTAFAVICAGTTATGAFQNVSGIGSAGQVLTSSGAGLPTWAAPAAPAIGPGTQYKIPVWATTTTLGDSALISDSGNKTLNYTPAASTTGGPTIFKINGPTHSGVSASFIDADFNLARTVALVSGSTIALAYGVIFRGMDFSSVGVGAHVTRAATVVIENYPRSATLGTLAVDTAYSLWVKEGITAIGNPSASTGQLFLYHASSAFSTGFQSGVATATTTYTLPTAGPAADGYILSSTTGGVMSWTSGASHALLSATHTDTTAATVVVGDLITGQTGPVWARLAGVATGNALISGGVATAVAWGKIGLTTHVSGTLPVANGGTGVATFGAGLILFGNGTSAIATDALWAWDNTAKSLSNGLAITGSQTRAMTGGNVSSTLFIRPDLDLDGSTINILNFGDDMSAIFGGFPMRVYWAGSDYELRFDDGNGGACNTRFFGYLIGDTIRSGSLGTTASAAFSYFGSAGTGIYFPTSVELGLTVSASQRFNLGVGSLTLTPGAIVGGAITHFTLTGAAHTAQTTGTEVIDVNWNLARTVQHAGSTSYNTQRAFLIQAPTYTGVTATATITNAATFAITGPPVASTNIVITNPYAAWIQTGNVLLGTASTATSILKFAHASSALLTGFQAGNATAAVTYTLPTADGSAGQFLKTNGSGVLSFASVNPSLLWWTTTSTTDTNNGEYDVYTTTIPANTLSANGDTILFWAGGGISSGAINARLKVYLAGAVIFDSQPFSVTTNYNGAESNSWSIRGFIIRSGSSGQKCIVHLAANTLGPIAFSSWNNAAGDTATGIILKITTGYQTPNTGWIFGEFFAGMKVAA